MYLHVRLGVSLGDVCVSMSRRNRVLLVSPLPPSLRLFSIVLCDVYVFPVRVVFLRGHPCDAQVPSTREVKVNWVRPGVVVHESEQV